MSSNPTSSPQTGILLVNIGTPDSPRVRDVRRYLREFLSDPPVLGLSSLARFLLLNFVILPLRPRRSAHAYGQIWLPEGSPLLVHSRALARAVAEELGPSHSVEIGMRYGNPSIREGLEALCRAGVERIIALPMFPQFSEAATGSAAAKVREEHGRLAKAPPLVLLDSFYADSGFIAAVAAVARDRLEAFGPDRVLMSFHGLPEQHVRAADPSGSFCLARESCCESIGPENHGCYRAQCYATARQLAAALDVEEHYDVAFQSRLGRTPWIRPYTEERLAELRASGVERLAVLCPAFVADCLETDEEIGIRARKRWLELGGEDFMLVPSLNHHPVWARAVAAMLRAAAPRSDTGPEG